MENSIKTYEGSYVGLSPTDKSPIAMGEIEVVIIDEQLQIRHATGLTLNEESVSVDEIRKLSDGEVKSQFNEGSDCPEKVDGFQIGEGAILLFWKQPEKDEAQLVCRLGEMSEKIGLTMLYNKESQNSAWDTMVQAIESEAGQNAFPRIEDGGKCRSA